MNYGQRKSSRKMKRPMHWYGNKQHPKKVRGKFKRQLCAIRVHAVTDKEIILSTSFAMYRIPRIALTLGGMFEKASQEAIQNVVGTYHSYCSNITIMFSWDDLEEYVFLENLEPFKIADKQVSK